MPNNTDVSYAKMAEPIKMPFGSWTPVYPRKHVLKGVQTSMQIFRGKDMCNDNLLSAAQNGYTD